MLYIGIEKLLDVVQEYADAQAEYFQVCKEKAEGAMNAVLAVFKLDREQCERVRIVARAVARWRVKTEWARLIPESMQEQIKAFIFGPPAPPSFHCERCGLWSV